MAKRIVNYGRGERKYERHDRRWKTYFGWVEYEADIGATQRPRDERHFRTKGDRDDWLQLTLAEGRVKSSRRDRGPTVGEAIEEYYQRGVTVQRWSHSHASNSRYAIDRHLLPALGTASLDRLEVGHVEAMVEAMVAQNASPHVIRHVRNALRAALNLAIRRGKLAGVNVAALAEIPEVKSRPPSIIPPESLGRFLHAIEGQRLAPLWQFELALASRPGEALALRWGDLDLAGRTVTFRRSVEHLRTPRDPEQREAGTTYGPRLKSTKTGEARNVALPDDIIAMLKHHRAELRDGGLGWRAGDLVFPSTTGSFLYEPYVRRQLQAVLRRAGLEGVTLYQLRHTGATLRLAAGVPLEVVQEDLGHSSILMTRRYAQVLPSLQRESADRMDALLGAARAEVLADGTVGTTAGTSPPIALHKRSRVARKPSNDGRSVRE